MQGNGLPHSDGALESTTWEVPVRRDIGAGGELHQGRQRKRDGGLLGMRFKALKERTEGVGLGKSQPEADGQRRRGG